MLHSLHGKKIKTIIVVSHDMNDVAEQCTSAVLFNGGKIVAVGTPKELFSDINLIKASGLEIPVTCYLENELASVANINSNYKIDDFVDKFVNIIRNKK